ncbi:lipocalin family protein [Alloyangia pacifica]|uniref:Apolipoprotein D and lipocalin family protein n=1 Tax=Alloyangia pacifica TaxID=311180 RepID=A0A1I6Q043_9RHOB|nr:lipocalin family protein [Alloyangia pacifica]SDG39524.1 apolipoprotein D and lipocalin family protein [Alloyangia pacifica]SFS45782.1 apolipoprotein D and lipocalin family protein [Alloyangia pacifica]
MSLFRPRPRLTVLLGAALLSACSAKAPPAPETLPLRNPTAPVGSQADAGLARLQGGWIVTEGAGMTPGARIEISAAEMRVAGVALPLQEETPGRLRVGGESLWVHWIDADNRTAVIGAPGGGRVWIMDRRGNPGERRAAAHEILDWYGYDLSRLRGA